jgi:hypothetical protein
MEAPDYAEIEVVHELPHDVHSSLNVSRRAEVVGHFVRNGEDLPIPLQASPPVQDKHRLKRTIVWLVVLVILLIVFAVVLGAVLGTTLASKTAAPTVTVTASPITSLNATPNSSPTASPNSSPTASPNSSPIASPSSIRKNTALSVTGWRSGSEFSIRLFYQGDDAYLRIIGFESGNGSWSAPSKFVQAKPGTPIAASSFNYGNYFGIPVWNLNMMRLEILPLTNIYY